MTWRRQGAKPSLEAGLNMTYVAWEGTHDVYELNQTCRLLIDTKKHKYVVITHIHFNI